MKKIYDLALASLVSLAPLPVMAHDVSPSNSYSWPKIKNESEPNGYIHMLGGSNYASCHDTISGYMHSDDLDYFMFYLPSRTVLDVSTTGDVDTVGTIYRPFNSGISYLPVVSNDDFGGGKNFRIKNFSLGLGFYYLLIKGYTKKSTGVYTLNVGCHILEHVNKTSSDWVNEATHLKSFPYASDSHLEEINYPGDNDLFRIDIEGNSKEVEIYTTGSTDTTGTLYNQNKNPIMVNASGGIDSNFGIKTELSEGRYYFVVSARGSKTGRYSLHVKVE